MAFSEGSTIQPAIVDALVQLGWTYDSRQEPSPARPTKFSSNRTSPTRCMRLNPLIAAEPSRLDEVMPKLRAVILSAVNDGVVAANERMTTWLRGHQTIKYVGTDDYVPVRLIDFEQLRKNNRLVVSDEVMFGTRA